jgi:hypothetical protein
MTMKRMIVEIGMGTDLTGADYTKAAVRALKDALWHNSLTIANAAGQGPNNMFVHVLIGVPKPEAVEPAPAPTPAPTPAPKPVVREDLPYGIPAVTKPGCVYSPYMTTQLVEVAGLARGTKVKCPYTGKHFRVP